MSKQPTIWDHDAHLALLQAIMAVSPPQPGEWEKILSEVRKKGYEYTASAAIQHLQKLRRKEEKNGGGDGAAGPSTPKTSGGRKKSVASSVKKEPGSGTKRKPVAVMSDDEEDMKPSKKFKDEPVKKEDSGKDSNIAYAG